MESKIMKTGNKVNLVVAEPEIYKYSVKDLDFAVLASDGVYDKLTNEQIVETVWETIEYYKRKYKDDCARKARLRGTSNTSQAGMRASLNTYTSKKLTERIRQKSQRKTYSQVFDTKKSKRGNSRNRNKSRSNRKNPKIHSQNLDHSLNSNNRGSTTSIEMRGRMSDLEPWILKCKENYSKILGDCVNNILKRSLLNESDDNVTLIMLVFKDLLQL